MTGGGGIAEVVDEILSHDPNTAGLAINWHLFGSNGQEKADYSKGLMEKFTRRAPENCKPIINWCSAVKTISNPRAIERCRHPHFPRYFQGLYSVNENGGVVIGPYNNPVTAEKIVLNHYYFKSEEETQLKLNRQTADRAMLRRPEKIYRRKLYCDKVFDDSILAYRDARAKVYQPPDKSHTVERLFSALASNLSPTLVPTTPPQFYAGKMETFLTCRAVAAYLQTKLIDDTPAKFFEEASLKAVLKSLKQPYSFADAGLLVQELPTLLKLSYPVVDELRNL